MDIELGQNIFQLKRRPCKSGSTGYKYEHGPFILDEELATVECGTCKEKLNPIQVLVAYARQESRIGARFEEAKLAVEKAQFKAERQNRVRCEHCDKLTRIRKQN
jgi:hypothetical protein